MTCDEAFELLVGSSAAAQTASAELFGDSSAPASRADLSRHLKTCPRCRQLQDVLSPLLDDASKSNGEQQPALSWSAIAAAPESVSLARDAARSLNATEQWRRRSSAAAVVLSYAAVFLIGAAGVWLASPAGASPALLAVQPDGCTRGMAQTSIEPRGLVLTCVACHLDRKVAP